MKAKRWMVVLFLAGALAGCGKTEKEEKVMDTTLTVTAESVKKGDLETVGTYVGSVVGASEDERNVVFHVPDTVAAEMKKNQKITAVSNGKKYQGTVKEIGTAADETGLFFIQATLTDADQVAEGVSVKLSTVTHRSEKKPLIPADSLYFKDNQAYVYVVENDKAVKKDVTLDIYGEEKATVSEGLSEKEMLITSWSGSLKDGADVKVTEENTDK